MAGDLNFRIGGSAAELKKVLASAQAELKAFATKAQAAVGNVSAKTSGRVIPAGSDAAVKKTRDQVTGLEKSIAGATSKLQALAAGFVTLAGVVKLVQAADEMTSLNARLRLVTGSTEEYNRAQTALFDIAQRSRTGLVETAQLYTQIANATKDAKVGQETLLGITETITQAMQVSGANAESAGAALVQFTQGLGAGALRGDELNSVLEQFPALADAIAKGMGKSRSDLKALGEQGLITSEAIIGALVKQKDAVAEQFKTLPPTVGQAVTQVKNSMLSLIGVFNDTSGATGGLAGVIGDFAAYLGSNEVLGAVVSFAAAWGNAFAAIVDDTNRALDIVKAATADFAGTGEDAVSLVIRAFKELPANIRAAVQLAATVFAAGVDQFVILARSAKEAFAAIFTDDTIEASVERRNRALKASAEAAKASYESILTERDAALKKSDAAGQAAVAARNAGRVAGTSTAATSLGKFKPSSAKAAGAADADAIAKQSEKLLKDSTDRSLRTLQNLYDDGLIATRAYFAERERIQAAAIDAEIAIEQKKLAGSKAGSKDALEARTRITLLERERTDVTVAAERERTRALADAERERESLRADSLQNDGQLVEAANIRLEQQYAETRKRMIAEGDTAGVELIDKLINTERARARFGELSALADDAMNKLAAENASAEAGRDSGALTNEAADSQQAAARTVAIEQLTEINRQMAVLAEQTKDPQIVAANQAIAESIRGIGAAGATGLEAAIASLRKSFNDIQQQFAGDAVNAAVGSVNNLFGDLIDGSKSAKDSLKDFVNGFAKSMAQIAANALATYLVLQVLDAIYPGLGQIAVAGASVSAKKNHSGGIAGSSGTPTRVNPMVFAGAPRYHSGGVVGLAPNEVPIIAEKGEEVLTAKDPRHSRNGGAAGGGGGNGTRIVNVMDPSLVSGFLASAQGEESILNIIGRNPQKVSQLIR